MTVVWTVEPCSLVEVDRRFRGVIIVLMIEAIRISETSVYFHKTTWSYSPESSHLHTRRRENLKSSSPCSKKPTTFPDLSQMSSIHILLYTLSDIILILSSHVRTGPATHFFPSHFSSQMYNAFITTLMRLTCPPPPFVVLDFIVLIIRGEK
jgi:hypothetical protein